MWDHIRNAWTYWSIVFFCLASVEYSQADNSIDDLSINENEQGKLPSKDYGEQFLQFEIEFTGGIYKNETFVFRLLPPDGEKQGSKYPLIIWLHGRGPVEYSHEDLGTLNWTNLLVYGSGNQAELKRDFYVLVPFCPPGIEWFNSSADIAKTTNDDMLSVVMAMLRRTLQYHLVDKDRISVVGISSGGTAAWEIAQRYPGSFSAIAPISSRGGDLSRVNALKDVPVWAFHNMHDLKTSPKGVQTTVTEIQKQGGVVALSLFDSGAHNSWTRAFYECHLRDWLLSQRRGQNRWTSKISLFFHQSDWWKPIAFWGVLALMACAGIRERMRRRDLKESPKGMALDDTHLV